MIDCKKCNKFMVTLSNYKRLHDAAKNMAETINYFTANEKPDKEALKQAVAQFEQALFNYKH